jgi:large subunit ribosomal protein L18
MAKGNKKLQGRIKRKRRIRAKISGTSQKPRLSVYRSCKHIYAQIIDDERGQTLFTVSDLSPQLVEEVAAKKKKEKAYAFGKVVASLCQEKGITTVVFDRNGYLYHGRIQELANGAREGGLKF